MRPEIRYLQELAFSHLQGIISPLAKSLLLTKRAYSPEELYSYDTRGSLLTDV